MKTLLKKPASLLAVLTMVLAIAFISSCSDSGGDPDPDPVINPNVLGSCLITADYYGSKSCGEYLLNFEKESESTLSEVQQYCAESKGTWGVAGSSCPIGYIDSLTYESEFGWISYEYPAQSIMPPANAIALTAGQWTEGTITNATAKKAGEVWYKFTAEAGTTTYYVWWDDMYSGPRTHADSDVRIRMYTSTGEDFYFKDDVDEYGIMLSNTVGTIYLKVMGENGSTFGITYSASSTMPGGEGGGDFVPPTNATALTSGQLKAGSITTSANEAWYTFNAVAGTTYYVWWDDGFMGSGTYNLDVMVSAWTSNGEPLIDGADGGYDIGYAIETSSSGPVYIRVTPYETGEVGTFGIAYSTGRVFGLDEASAIPLTAGDWKSGNILPEDEDGIYYKFEAVANTNYYLWLEDYYINDYAADVMILVLDSEGNVLLDGAIDEIGKYDPEVIRLTSSGTVYVNAFRVNDVGENNFFYIRYNTEDDSDGLWDYYAPPSAPAKISSAKKVSSAKKIAPVKAPKVSAKSQVKKVK